MVRKDLRCKTGDNICEFGFRLAGLKPVHHLQQQVFRLLIRTPLRVQTFPLQSVFPENEDRLVHLADLIEPSVLWYLDGVILFCQTAYNPGHARERHGDAPSQDEIKDRQEEGASQAKDCPSGQAPPVCKFARSVKRGTRARIDKSSECVDLTKKIGL